MAGVGLGLDLLMTPAGPGRNEKGGVMHFLILRRLFASSSRMLLALILGLIGFILTFVYDPDLLNQMISLARSFVEGMVQKFGEWGLSAKYTVWLNILNVADKLVFMGFVIAARIVMAVFSLAFFTLPYQLIKRASASADSSVTSPSQSETQAASSEAPASPQPEEAPVAKSPQSSPVSPQRGDPTAPKPSHSLREALSEKVGQSDTETEVAPQGARSPSSATSDTASDVSGKSATTPKPKEKNSLAKRLEELPSEEG